jgi:hypothetical protein
MRSWAIFLVAALAVPTTACTADSRPTSSDFDLRGGQTADVDEIDGDGDGAGTDRTGGELLRRGALVENEATPTRGITHGDALGPNRGAPVVR